MVPFINAWFNDSSSGITIYITRCVLFLIHVHYIKSIFQVLIGGTKKFVKSIIYSYSVDSMKENSEKMYI